MAEGNNIRSMNMCTMLCVVILHYSVCVVDYIAL